jgi:hypothetical protein
VQVAVEPQRRAGQHGSACPNDDLYDFHCGTWYARLDFGLILPRTFLCIPCKLKAREQFEVTSDAVMTVVISTRRVLSGVANCPTPEVADRWRSARPGYRILVLRSEPREKTKAKNIIVFS